MSEPALFMMGCRVFTNAHMMVGPFEDWSKVRSPGRARRRRKRGYRQNISFYMLPDPNLIQSANGDLFGHPATVAKLIAKIKAAA